MTPGHHRTLVDVRDEVPVATAPERRGPGRRGKGAGRWFGRDALTAVVFLIPALVVFGVFSWWPIVRGLLISFQRTNLIDPAAWVGLDNFAALAKDPLVGTAIGNTLLFVGLALLIGFPAPLVLATILSTVRRGACPWPP